MSTRFDPDEEYYAEFKKLVRARLPDGKSLLAEMRAAFDQFFAEEQIILSRREKHKLFQMIVEEVIKEMNEELQQLTP